MAAATRERMGVASVDKATAANLRLFTGCSLFLYMNISIRIPCSSDELFALCESHS